MKRRSDQEGSMAGLARQGPDESDEAIYVAPDERYAVLPGFACYRTRPAPTDQEDDLDFYGRDLFLSETEEEPEP